ncbi:hypothetical protein AAFM48_16880 [Burkholderia pseudomallei]
MAREAVYENGAARHASHSDTGASCVGDVAGRTGDVACSRARRLAGLHAPAISGLRIQLGVRLLQVSRRGLERMVQLVRDIGVVLKVVDRLFFDEREHDAADHAESCVDIFAQIQHETDMRMRQIDRRRFGCNDHRVDVHADHWIQMLYGRQCHSPSPCSVQPSPVNALAHTPATAFQSAGRGQTVRSIHARKGRWVVWNSTLTRLKGGLTPFNPRQTRRRDFSLSRGARIV